MKGLFPPTHFQLVIVRVGTAFPGEENKNKNCIPSGFTSFTLRVLPPLFLWKRQRCMCGQNFSIVYLYTDIVQCTKVLDTSVPDPVGLVLFKLRFWIRKGRIWIPSRFRREKLKK